MKRYLAIVPLAILALSCDEDTPVKPEPKPVVETYAIRDVDYIADKYFYFADPLMFIGPRAGNPQIEVFRSLLPADIIADPLLIRLPAWVMPDSVGDGQSIRDAAEMIKAHQHPSHALQQDVELLMFGEDYDLIVDSQSNRPIGIALFDPIPDGTFKAVAVRYINEYGQAVGGSYYTFGVSTTGPDTLMLKMLRAPDPRPQGPFGTVWRLMIRNIYNMGITDIDPATLKVEIQDVLNVTRLNADSPEGSSVKYLRIFGLDQTGRTGTGKPDGLIDLSYGYVDLTRGLLQFPTLEPFAPEPDSVKSWTDSTFAFTGQYEAQWLKSQLIYEEALNPIETQEVHQYIIKVQITKPAE